MFSHICKESFSRHFKHGQYQDLRDQNAEQVKLIVVAILYNDTKGKRTNILIKNPLQTLNLLQEVIMMLLCANLGRHLF